MESAKMSTVELTSVRDSGSGKCKEGSMSMVLGEGLSSTVQVSTSQEDAKSNEALSQKLLLTPSKLETLVKGLERAAQPKRESSKQPVSLTDDVPLEHPGVIDPKDGEQRGKVAKPEETQAVTSDDAGGCFQEKPVVREEISNKSEPTKPAGNFQAIGTNPQPKVEFVMLPNNDPRTLFSSQCYPQPFPIPGLPDHPPNLFFKINGEITEPVLSLPYLRALASRSTPSPPPPSYSLRINQDTSDFDDNPPPRRHVCPQCGKSFNFRFKLKNHSVKHSGLKPFTCETCGKGFSYRSTLATHQKTVHVKASKEEDHSGDEGKMT